MPVNYPLLVAYQSLYLTQESIVAVKHALNNNPSPDDALTLMDQLSDLETLKDALQAMRDQLEDGRMSLPTPDATLLETLSDLIFKVEAATQAGAAANDAIVIASQALNTGMAVMSLLR